MIKENVQTVKDTGTIKNLSHQITNIVIRAMGVDRLISVCVLDVKKNLMILLREMMGTVELAQFSITGNDQIIMVFLRDTIVTSVTMTRLNTVTERITTTKTLSIIMRMSGEMNNGNIWILGLGYCNNNHANNTGDDGSVFLSSLFGLEVCR